MTNGRFYLVAVFDSLIGPGVSQWKDCERFYLSVFPVWFLLTESAFRERVTTGSFVIRRSIHTRNEAITSPRDCFYVRFANAILAQYFPYFKDILGDISFLDISIGPERSDEIFFFYDMAGILNQHEKRGKYFLRKRHRFTSTQKNALLCIQEKWSEDKSVLPRLNHLQSEGEK